MELPFDLASRHIFVPGGAFRARLEKGTKYRYYFILNRNPTADNVILLVTATTKITQYRSKYASDVLVEMDPSEYKPLEQDSLVNCELARAYHRPDLEAKLRKALAQKKLEILDPLPEAILRRLCDALSECRNVAPIDKQLALGEENI